MEPISYIKSLGVKSILIINYDGLPIFSHDFVPDSLIKQNIVMISSFFTAFNQFAESLLFANISDFGVADQRIFYKYYSEFFYILVVDSKAHSTKSFYDVRELVDIILWQLTQEFSYIFDKHLAKLKAYELYNEIKLKFTMTIIELIYRGCKDWSENINSSSITKDTDEIDINNASIEDLTLKYGLESVYVLQGDKVVYEQLFNEAITIEGEIITSLFRAIESFTNMELKLNLQEIGLFNQRMFYRTVDKHVFIFLINDIPYFKFSIKKSYSIINSLINRIIPNVKKILEEEVQKDPENKEDDIFKQVLD